MNYCKGCRKSKRAVGKTIRTIRWHNYPNLQCHFCNRGKNQNFQIRSIFLILSEQINFSLKVHENISSPSPNHHPLTPSTHPQKNLLKCHFLYPLNRNSENFQKISKYHIHNSKGFFHGCTQNIATKLVLLHYNLQ